MPAVKGGGQRNQADSKNITNGQKGERGKRATNNNYQEKEKILWITKNQPAKCWNT